MEEDDVLNANNVPDWADLVQAFSKMQNDFFAPLKSADELPSPPVPNLDDLTWSSTYRALRAQKAIQAHLLQEMQKVQARISFLQMCCNKLALRRGIHLLPDEILALIFETGCTLDPEGNRFAVTVSHVNRRFRSISLRMPQLWSTITNYQGASELEEFLIRSKEMGVIVRLLPESVQKPFIPSTKFIPIIVRHTQRWIEFDHVFDHDITAQAKLSEYVLALPKLRKLINNSSYLGPALPKWSMPSLIVYEGDLYPGFSATTLVSCTLDLWTDAEYDGLDGVLCFISNNPTLRSLSLVFHDDFIPYMSRSHVDAKATLSSLETFSVQFEEGCYVDDDFERFMGNLNLPNVTQLCLRLLSHPHIRSSEYNDTSRLFRLLFPGLDPFPALDKLDLIIASCYFIPMGALGTLLHKLPSLRRLHIEAPVWEPVLDNWPGQTLSPLHFVEIVHCEHITQRFIESFVNELLRNDHSADDRMQTFTVANCRGLSSSDFRNLKTKLGDRFVFHP